MVIGSAASPGRERGGTMTDSKYFTTTKKGEGGLRRGTALGGGPGEVLPRGAGGAHTHTGIGVGRCRVGSVIAVGLF